MLRGWKRRGLNLDRLILSLKKKKGVGFARKI